MQQRGSDVFGDVGSVTKGVQKLFCRDQVECPASFVPVELIQTGIKGALYGTREEA